MSKQYLYKYAIRYFYSVFESMQYYKSREDFLTSNEGRMILKNHTIGYDIMEGCGCMKIVHTKIPYFRGRQVEEQVEE